MAGPKRKRGHPRPETKPVKLVGVEFRQKLTHEQIERLKQKFKACAIEVLGPDAGPLWTKQKG